jgi:hypothetical protein
MAGAERTVHLLTTALLTHAAHEDCPEVIHRAFHPDQGSVRVSIQQQNNGKIIVVKCTGQKDFKPCDGCPFTGGYYISDAI